MNGIVFLTLTVAFQGSMEFAWTQLPDNRVESIIQLDDHAIEALRIGQPLSSRLSSGMRNAERIQRQDDSNSPIQPVLSRKPQAFSPPQSSANPANLKNGSYRSPNMADPPSSLNAGVFNQAQFQKREPAGQVKFTRGNQLTVSNSSISAARPTAFELQEAGTNKALHWSNSNRVIGNIDDQNRAADSRSGFSVKRGFSIPDPAVGNRLVNGNTAGLKPLGVGGNSAAAVEGASRVSPGQGFVLASKNKTEIPTPSSRSTLAEPDPNAGGWNAVDVQGRLTGNSQNQSGAVSTNSNGSRTSGDQKSSLNTNFPNAQEFPAPLKTQPNGFISQFSNTVPSNTVPSNTVPSNTVPVTTAATNAEEVAALNRTIEELKNKQRKSTQDVEIAKLMVDQQDQLKKVIADFREYQKKEKTTDKTEIAVSAESSEDSNKGSSSAMASVFLVISLGLNVFLVVQYLSVQNQFRDLSNDLRDTFMSSHYE